MAEDNETNRHLISLQLSGLGYEADVAGDGREALARLAEQPYALLLTDCHMPDMDGFELTQTIRVHERESGGRLPIIALTANALQGEAERCRAAGMDDYLSKPCR